LVAVSPAYCVAYCSPNDACIVDYNPSCVDRSARHARDATI
jgi:hypothetical protein